MKNSFKPNELAWIAEANAKATQAGTEGAALLAEARRRLNATTDDPWTVPAPPADDWSAL